jgi:glycosyltransferase involved in cell wall biosynthesis
MSDTIAANGNPVHIVTYPFGDDLPLQHARLHRIRPISRSKEISVGPTLQKPLLNLLLVFKACQVIWKYQCDVIHAHNYEGALVGICAKIITGRPLLYNAVNTMSDELPSYNFIKPAFLARWLAAALDWFVPKIPNHLTTVSAELKDELAALGVPREKMTVLPAGVLPELFDHANGERFRAQIKPNGERVVLYAGTLDPFQRIDYLFEAFARLGPEFSDTVLFMLCPFTKPAQKQALDALAEKLGLASRLRWVESHPLHELADYMALADVAVAPRPQCPGHPVKLLNYMCMSLPLVVSAGAAKGIVHLQNGFVCKDHDLDDMALGMATLLRDRTLAEKLGRNARETITQEYDWRTLCRKIDRIYWQMLRGGGTGEPTVETEQIAGKPRETPSPAECQ